MRSGINSCCIYTASLSPTLNRDSEISNTVTRSKYAVGYATFMYSIFSPPLQIPVVLYHGTVQEREQLRRKHFSGDGRAGSASSKKGKGKAPLDEPLQPVMVTSYEICMKDQRFLMCKNWKFLVVDEGHRIKNLNCKLIRYRCMYQACVYM